ncbi:MAG: VOC family protein [Trueperaceae bacterium]
MATAHHYLNFNGNTEEAFDFYRSVFGGDFLNLIRFRDVGDMLSTDKLPEADRDKIMHVGLRIGDGSILMATDALESMGQKLNVGNNSYIYLETDSAQEANSSSTPSAPTKVEMGLSKTDWAEKYGACTDKFGVQWMVNYTGNVQFGSQEG